MKGRWEYNINVWFPFMYSQKWNCAAPYLQNRVVMFCLPIPTLMEYINRIFVAVQKLNEYETHAHGAMTLSIHL